MLSIDKPPSHLLLDSPYLKKFWNRRYELFERYDMGIQLDDESWFTTTPECIARHQAKICTCDFLIDAFSGIGGNTIQFALTCGMVLAVDNVYSRLLLLRNNAQIYGVCSKISLICADAAKLLRSLRVSCPARSSHEQGNENPNLLNSDGAKNTEMTNDCSAPEHSSSSALDTPLLQSPISKNCIGSTVVDVVFMSPPWGGPGYTGIVLPPGSSSWNARKRNRWFLEAAEAIEHTKNLEELPSFRAALSAARHLCPRVVTYLPRNSSIGQLLCLSWPIEECGCERCSQTMEICFEEYVLRGRRVALGVYIGRFHDLSQSTV
ncbi:unnamed protein product [Calicophoron daubneyi]|uniref:Trimethylguanosine synthase n=1 Tax=Calicophoron daubneyi TaxID=300641 RepID=A0AAV2TCH5_CALDB